MKEYIEREALDLEYYDLLYHGTMAVKVALPVFKDLLDKQPAADVVEKVYGEWIEKEVILDPWDEEIDIVYVCSICESDNFDTTPFCPNCGADMRGKPNEE